MNLRIFILASIVAHDILIINPALAKPIDSIDMHLSTYQGKTRVEHFANFPMSLKLIISTMGEPISVKEQNAIKDAIRFVAQDIKSNALPVEVKPMANCSTEKETVIDQKHSVFLQFGIAPEQWNKIKEKTLKLCAEMKITNADSAVFKSNTIEIDLKEPESLPVKSLGAIQNNYEAGSFYLQQKDFARVEQYAKALEPVAASLAWELRGDALLGQGNKTEAKKAYSKSLNSNDVVLPDQMRELTAAKLFALSGENK